MIQGQPATFQWQDELAKLEMKNTWSVNSTGIDRLWALVSTLAENHNWVHLVSISILRASLVKYLLHKGIIRNYRPVI
jgi:hypothetical protein